jgi:hypothetical protein
MSLNVSVISATWENLLVLLQILGTLETLSAFAPVGLEGDVHSDVAGDVITLRGLCVAISPGTGQAQVVRRLAANMLVGAVGLQQRQRRMWGTGCVHRDPRDP